MTKKESVRLAQDNGFKKMNMENANGGTLYVKNGLKWIHDIRFLVRKLNVNEQRLRNLNYDVDTYYDVISNQVGLLKYA